MEKYTMPHNPLVRAGLALALGLALSPAAQADEAALKSEIDVLRAEVAALQAAVRQMQAGQSQAVAAPPPATPGIVAPAPAPALAGGPSRPATSVSSDIAVAAPATRDSVAAGTTIWGYGELNYNRPTGDAGDTQADLRRAVIGFGHSFDESTRVYGEFEWEHAVTSADDQGETEVEQLYVEHSLAENYGVRAGLMLIPLGLLNEHHEPPTYYGVERNLVETAIIPTTWREGGVALYGANDSGFNWSAGITTGFDLSKWDASSTEGREEPLGSIHQELQLAKARDASIFVAGNWQGVPGLLVGGGVFTGKVGQGQDFAGRDARLTLGEVHARWQTGPFDLSALYARGHISDTEALNLTFVGQPAPVPENFWGGYVQGAWKVWQRDDASFAPFLRYELVNTAATYTPMPAGLGVDTAETEHVWTVGANWWINPSVVFKLDLQNYHTSDSDRLDLGMGYMF